MNAIDKSHDLNVSFFFYVMSGRRTYIIKKRLKKMILSYLIGKELTSSSCKTYLVAWQYQANMYRIYVHTKIFTDSYSFDIL